MGEGDPSAAARAVRRTAVVAVVLAALGFLADVTGLVGFLTGKDLPDLFDSRGTSSVAPPPATAGTSGAGTPDAGAPQPSGSDPGPTSTGGPAPVDGTTEGRPPARQQPAADPGAPPATTTTTDAVKNFQLSLSPGEFAAGTPRTILIETSDGGVDTFVDVEIADPAASGGVCPRLSSGPCNLVYSGGAQADASGYARVDFEWFGDAPGHDGIHHPGTYTVTAQDRGTGAKVSIDFTAR
ncbi:hypothetical protein [Umezawaea sp.]|uniref:hypothetical protein n=1 Tax=Umezawaea sp. TaxID=1955258 RepID=UPI002ED292D3